MANYLLKLTIIWALSLLIYELLYRKATSFKANRIYLFTAMLSGIIIPLIPLNIGSNVSYTSNIVRLRDNLQQIDKIPATPITQPVIGLHWDVYQTAEAIYLSGLVIIFIISVREIILILRKAIYGTFITVQGHKIFSSTKSHAPFSFMGWIFISDPKYYSEQELTFILKHEDAHNRSYHWLDMILIQLLFIVFWFHPLIWRFRHLLKLNHEFEADNIAASENKYEYGHFLLTQTMLKGTPVIAHSFHFSPIKNRINMLTQKTKTSSWRYVLIIPVLLGCTVLFAKSIPNNQRIRVGDVTSYQGHSFRWTGFLSDTIEIMNPENGKKETKVMQMEPNIYLMDKDSVYAFRQSFNNFQTPKFRTELQGISDYFTSKFKEKIKDPLDSISQINIENVVLDANGKIKYYEVIYRGRHFSSPHYSSNPTFDPIIEDIIEHCPAIETMSLYGKPQPTFILSLGAVELNSLSGRATPIKPKK